MIGSLPVLLGLTAMEKMGTILVLGRLHIFRSRFGFSKKKRGFGSVRYLPKVNETYCTDMCVYLYIYIYIYIYIYMYVRPNYYVLRE